MILIWLIFQIKNHNLLTIKMDVKLFYWYFQHIKFETVKLN